MFVTRSRTRPTREKMTERQMKEVNRQKSTTASTEKNVFQEEEAAFLLCLLCMYGCRSVSRASVVLCDKKKRPFKFRCSIFSGETLNKMRGKISPKRVSSKEEEEQQQQQQQ